MTRRLKTITEDNVAIDIKVILSQLICVFRLNRKTAQSVASTSDKMMSVQNPTNEKSVRRTISRYVKVKSIIVVCDLAVINLYR